ncbi:MAG: 3-hydroxyacyl-ACP dehydratase FabZ [Pseudomonadota bacterium]
MSNPVHQQLSLTDIMALIPHRYPMLLVDKAEVLEPERKGIGYKSVTFNEPFFQGHFPQKPIMPGVLIVEAMAQTAAVITISALAGDHSDKLVYFMSIDGAKFRKPVVPGDQLAFHVELEKARGAIRRFACKAMVDDQLAAEATVQAMIADA